MYWYQRYEKATTEREKLFSLYNAIGSLSFGFGGILEAFPTEEQPLIIQMLRRVKSLQMEENDSGNPVETTKEFTKEELDRLAAMYLRRRQEDGK